MGWLEALILGLVQGLTEFLPISSSAHISIVGRLISGKDPGAAFTAITQIGTELAVVLYFARDIGRIISRWCKALFRWELQGDPDVRMGWLVIIGSIPIVVLGLLFEAQIESVFRNLWLTVAMLAGFGLIIGIVDHFAKTERTLDQITWKHGILFGLAQSLALIPGVSRSGATIAAGLAMGYKREAAARYGFLLAIPAVLGSGFYQLFGLIKDEGVPTDIGPIILATVIAFGVGLAVIHWLLRYISTHNFLPFVIYRLVLAAVLAVLLITGLVPPVSP
ncbi:undecaprenyl-diphosphate phosphatase [Microlunatus parietis]|uniref:Undecaprenyl-diphosphatase n=1 Tax=Microlunatus parietis TaxID=682979 RepID=A0A7Y9LBC9_9ACTN|nr:undecaprenyl-diphosphate phosphatase [Microlunatus parietis]NYE69691.1 undecaprenyl-diphosphatase [Microlunatus parietis]